MKTVKTNFPMDLTMLDTHDDEITIKLLDNYLIIESREDGKKVILRFTKHQALTLAYAIRKIVE